MHVSEQTRLEVPGPRVSPAIEATRSSTDHLAEAAGLRVLAAGRWPGYAEPNPPLPGVPGFIVSSFSPMVVEAARRALSSLDQQETRGLDQQEAGGLDQQEAGGLDHQVTPTTAIVIVSAFGDLVSARAVAAAVDAGTRVGPLMFFQSVPNAVAGHVAKQWGLTGPVVAISPADDALAAGAIEGIEVARLLIADGDADRALVVFVEQQPDRALALLVTSFEQHVEVEIR
jgi:Beta-ketoacyl synthase, N-terminal domain